MNKDELREETSKFSALSGCIYNDEICFLGMKPSLLFVIHPEISLRQSPSCVREIYVSAVDKYMRTWVSSTNK